MYRLFKITTAVSAIVHIVSATYFAIRPVASAALLVAEVIGDGKTDRTAMPSVLAELPESVSPCSVSSCTAVQQISYIQSQSQLFV